MEELINYYIDLGAPDDQTALVSLLRQIQKENNGIPQYLLPELSQKLQVKESFLLALIKRIPSLRLQNVHCLEICAGPNCGKRTALASFAQKHIASDRVTVKFVPCMRMCGKGPNIRVDGKLYHGANEALLRKIISEL